MRRGPAAVEGPGQRRVHHAPPLGVRQFRNRRELLADAGVVDEDVYPAEFGEEGINGRAVGNVEGRGAGVQTLGAQPRALGLRLFQLEIGGYDACALSGELAGDAQAQTLCRPGHHGAGAFEVAVSALTHCRFPRPSLQHYLMRRPVGDTGTFSRG